MDIYYEVEDKVVYVYAVLDLNRCMTLGSAKFAARRISHD